MSAREWQPGDVAALNFKDGTSAIGVRHERHYWNHSGEWGGGSAFDEIGGHEARPLVVIDPEDREQVERLHTLWCQAIVSKGTSSRQIDSMQAALREYANPKPPKCPARLDVQYGDGKGQPLHCNLSDGHEGPHSGDGFMWTAVER